MFNQLKKRGSILTGHNRNYNEKRREYLLKQRQYIIQQQQILYKQRILQQQKKEKSKKINHEIVLTILVPTIPSRLDYFYPRIMSQLIKQTEKYNNIELLSFFDNKKRTIGKKRDDMLNLAQGKYFTFVDDDDIINNDYIDEIMSAISKNSETECITLHENKNSKRQNIIKRKNLNKKIDEQIENIDNEIVLTILVPTVPSRIDYFYPRIMSQLIKQTKKYNNIELLSFFDNKKRTIGKKRDDMLKLAQGKYLTFIDDDDRISNDYIDEIMNAIAKNNEIDCIVYNNETKLEHLSNKKVLCKYGIEFDKTGYINDEETQWRGKPAHTMIWKSMIAKKHSFSDMGHGEDYEWVKRACLDIKTQHRINKILYYYDACYATTSEFKT